jgi:pyruvoyl-dependent arginine decarboxylase (PvlArgDC)
MLSTAKRDVADVALVLTGSDRTAPQRLSDEQLDSLCWTAPRCSGPIIAEALVSASKKCDFNTGLIEELVHATFARAQAHARRAVKTWSQPGWRKHLQQIVLNVVRTAATPGERAPHANWSRAMLAAHFCMGLWDQTESSTRSVTKERKHDVLWILLSYSNCATGTSNVFARRATNWYGMLTRVAVSLTPVGKWQEAHAAMRQHGDLVKEVVSQIRYMERAKTISAAQIELARDEMCMGSAKEREGKGGDMCAVNDGADVPLDDVFDDEFVFASMLADEDDEVAAMADGTGIIDLPEWCTAAAAPEAPETPPQARGKAKGKLPMGAPAKSIEKKHVPMEQMNSHLAGTVKGFFRVTIHRHGLPPALDLVTGRQPPPKAKPAKAVKAKRVEAAAPPIPRVFDLMCHESSADLMRDTVDWQPAPLKQFSIIDGRIVKGPPAPRFALFV